MQSPAESRVAEAIKAVREIEAKYNVSLTAKGRAFGGAWLAIRDHSTGEIFDVEEIERGELNETNRFGALDAS